MYIKLITYTTEYRYRIQNPKSKIQYTEYKIQKLMYINYLWTSDGSTFLGPKWYWPKGLVPSGPNPLPLALVT